MASSSFINGSTIIINPNVRKCVFNEATKHYNNTNVSLFPQLLETIKAKRMSVIEIDVVKLAKSLSNLSQVRFTKTAGEIILEYKSANPGDGIQLMAKRGAIPFHGSYDQKTNSSSFDLKYFPDSLVIVLQEFVDLIAKHAPPPVE